MKNIFRKSILSLLALLPIPGISYGDELTQHQKLQTGNLNLESMSLQQFRSLMFPVNSEPISGEEAYSKFHSLFVDQDEAAVDHVFNQYVDKLIKTDRLKTDGTTLFMGNVSGGYQSK